MSNISVTSQSINVNVTHQVVLQNPKPQPAPVQSQPPRIQDKPLFKEDSLSVQVNNASVPSTPTQMIKKMAGGLIIGGTASSIAQSIGSSIVASGRNFKAMGPTTTGATLGAALGLGIGLANLDAGDKNVNNIKSVVAGALIGGSSAGIATAIGNTIFAESTYTIAEGFVQKIGSPAAIGIGLGIAAGVGIAILNMEE